MVILMHTCDAYKWQWDSFIHYFDKHWKGDEKRYIATEELDTDYEGWENIKTGKGAWSDRLAIALNAIDDEYVFYIQEDIWLNKDFHPKESILETINHGVFAVVHFGKDSKNYTYKYNYNRIKVFSNESSYLMNHKPAVWDMATLLFYLEPNESPQKNEIEGTKRMWYDNFGEMVGLVVCDYYDDVCRKGELTEIGKKRLI